MKSLEIFIYREPLYLQSYREWDRLLKSDISPPIVDRQALMGGDITLLGLQRKTESLGQALKVTLVKPVAYLSNS